jgi:FMN phosphatase YigB (HAD superfamily)
MVGNDPVSDVRGATRAGIDAVLVDRRGKVEARGSGRGVEGPAGAARAMAGG